LGTRSAIEWINCRQTGKWEIIKDRGAEDISLPPSIPSSSNARSRGEGPLEGWEEGSEVAMAIGLVTEMSHHFPHSPMDMSSMTVQACSTAEISKKGDAVKEGYHRHHQEVP
jgi:hypothetical protein